MKEERKLVVVIINGLDNERSGLMNLQQHWPGDGPLNFLRKNCGRRLH